MNLDNELSKYDFLETDLTFFTNEKGKTLLDRFRRTLRDTQYFDVVVGYFRTSGFHRLYKDLEKIDKIRILVGLSIDRQAYEIIESSRGNGTFDFETHKETRRTYSRQLQLEIENSPERDQEIESGVRKFIEFLRADCVNPEEDKKNGGNGKKMEIRAFPSKNLHAKVYISRYHKDDRDFGNVVTGSSNFSESGLIANREFNVQLKNKADVLFALKQFQELWKESVDISEEFVDTINYKTWLNDEISPYELYLKLLYEYFQEEINYDSSFDPFLPEGFLKLEYQKQAATQAKKILETYNGVFLADVVGLGKTFITALLLQQLRGRFLVICPPVLKDYWFNSLFDFRVPAVEVESLGKLEHILRKGTERYDYIIVDEAHRFRNETTQSYAQLLDICRGKKVILVTATPLNNKIHDIFSQLKLFQVPRRSTIPGVPNLEKYFNDLSKELNKWDRNSRDYSLALNTIAEKIRTDVLAHVMVRRTRTDVVNHFQEDMQKQGLTFPDVSDPQKLIYEFKGYIEGVFNRTMTNLKLFKYARYTPLDYYIGAKVLSEFERQQQRNVGAFMKGLLVKRLESSIYAFKQSIDRFIKSYERFIEMYENGTVYISKKVNVYDLIDNDDFEKLEELVSEETVRKYDSKDFRESYKDHLEFDLRILNEIRDDWRLVDEDPKLNTFLDALRTKRSLKKNKLVIFTESKETGDHLYKSLIKEYPDKVIFYASKGGRHTNEKLTSNHQISRDLIKANFDPNSREKENKLRILITTDILAEGINLHRSNILVNYDLPWNPTRVLQRAGRVNRLGSKHNEVFIYNFFPTTQADAHLGLERNITSKIQLFHNILGEDAKYLSDGEEIGSQELFDTLNKKSTYTGEDGEGDSELDYLSVIRDIRDNDPNLFDKIKRLPKKARSGFKVFGIDTNQLLTFFRTGMLKKFYQNKNGQVEEVTFFDAVKLLECEPKRKRAKIPKEYFHLLGTNKAKYVADLTDAEVDAGRRKGGSSNINYILKRLKDKSFKHEKRFTEGDEEFIANVKRMIELGMIAKKTAQILKKEIEKELNPLNILKILRKNIQAVSVEPEKPGNIYANSKKEIILSGYIIPANDE